MYTAIIETLTKNKVITYLTFQYPSLFSLKHAFSLPSEVSQDRWRMHLPEDDFGDWDQPAGNWLGVLLNCYLWRREGNSGMEGKYWGSQILCQPCESSKTLYCLGWADGLRSLEPLAANWIWLSWDVSAPPWGGGITSEKVFLQMMQISWVEGEVLQS